jgi:trehalose 6-phosphate phosphatase
MTLNPATSSWGRPPHDLLRGASLFLDFDGTLVDIAPSPDEVLVTSELSALLERLLDLLHGRVAILTGRHSKQVEEMLGSNGLTIGGHHGLEARAGGKVISAGERPPILDEVVRQLRRFASERPGVLIEEKPLGVAVHFREAPSAEEACRAAVEAAAHGSDLIIQPGKMVFELRPGGTNKGDALRKLAGTEPFRGFRPIFMGDDLTDEPAFSAARELGGDGILIGEPRATAASFRLPTVSQAIEWLGSACEAA